MWLSLDEKKCVSGLKYCIHLCWQQSCSFDSISFVTIISTIGYHYLSWKSFASNTPLFVRCKSCYSAVPYSWCKNDVRVFRLHNSSTTLFSPMPPIRNGLCCIMSGVSTFLGRNVGLITVPFLCWIGIMVTRTVQNTGLGTKKLLQTCPFVSESRMNNITTDITLILLETLWIVRNVKMHYYTLWAYRMSLDCVNCFSKALGSRLQRWETTMTNSFSVLLPYPIVRRMRYSMTLFHYNLEKKWSKYDSPTLQEKKEVKMRGVKKAGSSTLTSTLLGTFETDRQTRYEYFGLLRACDGKWGTKSNQYQPYSYVDTSK